MITLLRNNNKSSVMEFMLSDEVWETFACDMSDKKHYNIDIDELWLNVYIDDEFSGMVRLHNENLNTIRLHMHMIKNRKHCRNLVNKVLELFLSTPEFVNKIIVSIPTYRKIAYNLAKRTGFKDEGINKESVLKDGIFHDQWNVGLTKQEARQLCQA